MCPANRLIPRALLFGNPSRLSPRISPTGEFLSFLAPWEGVLNIWTCRTAQLDSARPVTRSTKRAIRFHAWTRSGSELIYIQDADGDENYRLHRVSAVDGKSSDLAPFPRVQSRIIKLSRKFPHQALVGFNQRDPRWHDVFRLDLTTGDATLIHENKGFSRFIADDDLQLRLAVKTTPDAGYDVCRIEGDGTWQSLFHVDSEDAMTTQVVGIGPADTSLVYLLDSRARNTAAAVALDIAAGTSVVLGEHPKTDVVRLAINPLSRRAEAYLTDHVSPQWTAIDPAVDADLHRLRNLGEGDFDVTSRTADDRQWIISYNSDSDPTAYYHYDRDRGETSFLFSTRPELASWPLARMTPVVIPSRDELQLVSYLTRPSAAKGQGEARPLPMVLLVHGGPWTRDRLGFNPLHQFLANRGYVVLSVNFRGSTGFGKEFLNAGNREWGRRMQDDLADAVRWTIDRGVADGNRIAIMGASYGGYATLIGLTSTPHTFACGIDMFGPSNLETFLAAIPPYWKSFFETLAHRIGDPRTDEGRKLLRERSPLHHVDRISRPLIVVQGANDVRAPRAESDQLVEAMQDRGLPVIYLFYPDEGHNLVRPQNRLSFLAIVEAFLAEHLGGRREDFGSDLSGGSLEVLAGAAMIDRLAASPRETTD